MDLQFLGLILLMLGLGIFVGSRPSIRTSPLPWLGRAQTVILLVLIALLGVNIGADQRVIESLGDIGLSAFVIAGLALAGTLVAVTVVRRLLGLGRDGLPKKPDSREEDAP